MHICLLIDDLDLTLPGGGAQRSTQLIADELQRRGHRLSLITAGPFAQERMGFETKTGKLYQFQSKPAGSWSDFTAFLRPGIVGRVLPTIAKLQPDIIQAHVMQNYLSFGLLWAVHKSLPEIPLVLTMHDHSALCRGALRCKGRGITNLRTKADFRLPSSLRCWQCQKHTFNPLKRFSLLWVLNRCCHTVVFVSQALRNFYLANGLQCPSSVIYNGAQEPPLPADATRIQHFLRELDLEGGRIVLAGGRMRPTKGYHLLVEALPLLVRQAGEDIRLVVYGQKNSYADQLKVRAEALGVGGHLVLPGWLAPQHLSMLISVAEVGVVPSIGAEALPRSVFDYMIQGVATAASRVGGSKEVIRHGINGMLIDPWNPCEVAKKLGDLLASRDLCSRLGSQGRETILSRFMTYHSVSQRLSLYQQLLESKN